MPCEGPTLRRLAPGDETLAARVAERFKQRTPGEGHLARFLAREEHYLIVALAGGEPVGFVLGYELQRLGDAAGMMFLYELEVAESYRHRGLGRALVRALLGEARRRGLLKTFVLTGAGNAAALATYTSAGGVRLDEGTVLFEFKNESPF